MVEFEEYVGCVKRVESVESVEYGECEEYEECEKRVKSVESVECGV